MRYSCFLTHLDLSELKQNLGQWCDIMHCRIMMSHNDVSLAKELWNSRRCVKAEAFSCVIIINDSCRDNVINLIRG